jgi:predicted deacylase
VIRRPKKRSAYTVKIASLRVSAGERKTGWLEVARLASGSVLSLPLMVIVGVQSGPTVGLIAGVHGDEYEGLRTIWDLYHELNVASMRGSVVMVPIASPAAFQASSRTSPLDGVNLNRVFPGRAAGSVSERIASVLVEQVVARCNVLLDLHSGGAIMELLPLVMVSREDLATAGVPDLIRATGLPLVWFAPQYRGTLAQAALARGIPALTVEVGGLGRLDTSGVATMKDAVLSALRHTGVVHGSGREQRPQAEVEGEFLKADVGGFFQGAVSLGQRIASGEPYGAILDHFGTQIAQLVAPHDGVVSALRTSPPVQVGDQLILIGRVS